MARPLLIHTGMDQASAVRQEPVTGRIGFDEASAAGLDAVLAPLTYEAYERGGTRYGWTRQPDATGSYHALTLQLQDDGRWTVTADQPFDRLDDAQEWAVRLFAETEN